MADKQNKTSIPGLDKQVIESEGNTIFHDASALLNLFFSDQVSPNSRQEKKSLDYLENIARNTINDINHENILFYRELLDNPELCTAGKEIVLYTVFLSTENQTLQQHILDAIAHKSDIIVDAEQVREKLKKHMIQRCTAVAHELNLKPSALTDKLDKIASNCITHAARLKSPPTALVDEIQSFALKLSITVLSDLLPPKVSRQQPLEILMSDHLPQLYTIGNLRVLNWNILTKNFFIGFADATQNKSVMENNDQYTNRLKNIAHFLVEVSNSINIDFMTLQEAYEDLYQYLSVDFRHQWDLIADKNWKILFCKKKTWKIEHSLNVSEKLKEEFRKKQIVGIQYNEFQGYILKNRKTGEKVCIYNVYTAHEDEPDNLELALLAIHEFHRSNQILHNIPSYIFGDFNRRLQNTDIYAKDNATHLVPPMFRTITNPAIYYDYTDCCFELSSNQIIQYNGHFLDSQNPGEFFHRPLVTLEHALKDTHFTKVIFPLSHQVRVIDNTGSIYGSITMGEFKNSLATLIKQRIIKMTVRKNRYGILFVHLHCKNEVPLFKKLGILGEDGYYAFRILPHTAENQNMHKATPEEEHLLTNVMLLRKNNEPIALNLKNTNTIS